MATIQPLFCWSNHGAVWTSTPVKYWRGSIKPEMTDRLVLILEKLVHSKVIETALISAPIKSYNKDGEYFYKAFVIKTSKEHVLITDWASQELLDFKPGSWMKKIMPSPDTNTFTDEDRGWKGLLDLTGRTTSMVKLGKEVDFADLKRQLEECKYGYYMLVKVHDFQNWDIYMPHGPPLEIKNE